MKKVLVVLGATSTGKTDLALQLAKKFKGELVACDSRQVYKGLDIGTGKLPSKNGKLRIENGKWIFDAIPIHMYDVADFKKQYSVFDYAAGANKVIDDIFKREKLSIIVGGTGLYLRALLEGLPNLATPVDLKLRKELEKLSREELQDKLKQISSDRWEKLNESDKQNPRRLIRAIEIMKSVKFLPRGKAGKVQSSKLQFKIQNFNYLKIGLVAPREILYKRIDERVVDRINQGMIEEAETLHREGLSFERMRKLGLEYAIIADYLEGKIKNKEDLIKILQGKIHGYARRQETWFKREKNVVWFDITQDDWVGRVESRVNSWYHDTYDQKN